VPAKDISERRPLVFLAVLVSHGVILSWLLRADRLRVAAVTSPANTLMVAETQAPPVDWRHEAQVAVDAALAKAEAEQAYRNMASLSPEQLSWVRQNHWVPAKPGIPWKYRRVEVTPDGFPIIHINDHCVAIPLLLMAVFCQIGHIEPNGKLFEHMRDPRNP
jgi:hypothetical protein